MKLFVRKSGQGEPLIILHGLFGSSDNWFSNAKTFAEHFTVYLVDQRNHGQSPHSDEFNYQVLTEDLAAFFEEHQLEKAYIIGHSMGGKTAMNFAVKYPEKVIKLIVVDIVPKSYRVNHDHILEGLMSLDLPSITSRTEADEALSKHVSHPVVRQFLLKNLGRDKENQFEWKLNLQALSNHIEEIGAGMQYEGVFEGATMFIIGEQSNYYEAKDEATIKKIFPTANLEMIDASHWVHAEKPEEFAEIALAFLQKDE